MISSLSVGALPPRHILCALRVGDFLALDPGLLRSIYTSIRVCVFLRSVKSYICIVVFTFAIVDRRYSGVDPRVHARPVASSGTLISQLSSQTCGIMLSPRVDACTALEREANTPRDARTQIQYFLLRPDYWSHACVVVCAYVHAPRAGGG